MIDFTLMKQFQKSYGKSVQVFADPTICAGSVRRVRDSGDAHAKVKEKERLLNMG